MIAHQPQKIMMSTLSFGKRNENEEEKKTAKNKMNNIKIYVCTAQQQSGKRLDAFISNVKQQNV